VGATSSAAVVPNSHRLQADNADDTTSFDDNPTTHTASLERPPRDGNGRFGAGNARRLTAQGDKGPIGRFVSKFAGGSPRIYAGEERFSAL
jgi:hypothetical protein